MYTTLYARAQNGKIKVWRIEDKGNFIYIEHGYYTGNLARHASKVTMSSANAEVLSKIKKKKREGYKDKNDLFIISNQTPKVITPEYLEKYLPATNLDLNYNLKPMKCERFKPNKMKYPALAQPKLNGVRGVLRWELVDVGSGVFAKKVKKAVIRSKSGLMYHLPHITDHLTYNFFIDYETQREVAYDGEIYLHGTPLNMINGASPLINDRGTIASTKYPHVTPQLQFVIFDVAMEDMVQQHRLNIVENTIPFIASKFVDVLVSKVVNSDSEVQEYALECINKGYEGAVVRNMDTEYAFGSRPITIMKVKVFMDAEFKVIDVIPKPKEPDTALFVLRNDINDDIFECNPMGSRKERGEYLTNKTKYIGQMATVKFYERSGVKKVPFHANVVTIRPKHDIDTDQSAADDYLDYLSDQW